MRFGISIPNFATPDQLLEVARATDAGGWDGFFLWDHTVVDRADPPPVSEPWTVLAAAAMVTSRVRLGSMVTPVARRRPWVLARQVATVDHLSGGRAVLGVGLGIPADLEYGALGEPVEAAVHAARLDEGLEVIDRLWSGERVTHAGPHYQVDDLIFRPVPVQRPRVPIWSAAALPARAGVRRAARWDGVAPIYIDDTDFRPVTPDEVAGIVAEVRELRPADAPFDVAVWAVAPDEPLRRAYAEAGATWLIEGPAQVPDWIDDAVRIAREGPPPS